MKSAAPASMETLRRLAQEQATGELVCAAPDAEVHVHLQGGRVAWATSSVARFAFGRYVLERCDLDADALRELVSECRREKKPLGETLIEWGVASADAVRGALREQIVDALDTLREAGPAQTVFLQRGAGYRSYNPTFTFDLDEVCRARRRSRPSEPKLPRRSSHPPPKTPPARLLELVAEEPEVRWVEHHCDGAVTTRLPAGTPPVGIHRLASELFADDVRFAVVRTGRDHLIGVELPRHEGSVWCAVDPTAVLGAMVTLLRERLGAEPIMAPGDPSPMGSTVLSSDRGLAPSILEELLERTGAVWAVAIVDGQGVAHPLARREAVDAVALVDRVTRFSELLRTSRRTPPSGDAGMALPRASMVAASSRGWLFGGELLDDSGRDLWLFVDARAGQGLGWAVLESLLRHTSLTSKELAR